MPRAMLPAPRMVTVVTNEPPPSSAVRTGAPSSSEGADLSIAGSATRSGWRGSAAVLGLHRKYSWSAAGCRRAVGAPRCAGARSGALVTSFVLLRYRYRLRETVRDHRSVPLWIVDTEAASRWGTHTSDSAAPGSRRPARRRGRRQRTAAGRRRRALCAAPRSRGGQRQHPVQAARLYGSLLEPPLARGRPGQDDVEDHDAVPACVLHGVAVVQHGQTVSRHGSPRPSGSVSGQRSG
jgi:hypothetical protein